MIIVVVLNHEKRGPSQEKINREIRDPSQGKISREKKGPSQEKSQNPKNIITSQVKRSNRHHHPVLHLPEIKQYESYSLKNEKNVKKIHSNSHIEVHDRLESMFINY